MTTGCGYPTDVGGEVFTCGTRLAGMGDVAAILCPTCNTDRLQERLRWEQDTRPCLVCGEPAAFEALCGPCGDELRRDLAEMDHPDEGHPGSRCQPGCGYCGRCGGA